jgi:ABC-type lipoprotein release transport system permease subunit
MKTYIKLAWRNLWRSKTRTMLTVTVVMFVVIIASMMSSQQYGIYDKMIENVTEMSGHLQIQDTGYKENKTINYTFSIQDSLLKLIEQTNHVELVSPRLESFSLASTGEKTKGVAVVGLNPEKEKQMLKLNEKLIRYKLTDVVSRNLRDSAMIKDFRDIQGYTFLSYDHLLKNLDLLMPELKKDTNLMQVIKDSCQVQSVYLANDDRGVLLGDKLSRFLNVTVGDTLTMISQGYHGISAAGLFPVRGIVKLPVPGLERRVVFMELGTCQEYYSAYGMLSSLLIKAEKNKYLKEIEAGIDTILPALLTVDTWEEIQPETVQMIQSDKAGGSFMKTLFYVIVGFIILGTILMMMAERKKEFGILLSIGLYKTKLSIILFFETLFISGIGALVGLLLSFPIMHFMNNNPIPLKGEMADMMEDFGFEAVMYFSDSAHIFISQAVSIFIIAMAIYLVPLYIIRTMNIVKAVRG